ncbi:MAG: long-chain acyl-CoA synthetase, partial [Thermodesulfobacteriota bacterium]|nr:long-chain acyl-CoA synthetase [Thermodesulfobacteriota bacterium]
MNHTMQYPVDESKPWLQPQAGWPPEVPKNYDFPRITLYEMFVQAANKYADQNVIWFLNSFMTYKELLGHVDCFAVSLNRLGLKKGDVVAIALPSCFQYVIAYYACAKLGVIVTGVNPTYKPGEVLHELTLTNANTLIILDALYAPLIAPIADQYKIQRLISTNVADLLKVSSIKKWLGKKLKKIPTGTVPAGSLEFLDLL